MHDAPWFILGAGAIGGLFAAELRRAGIPVRLLLRDNDRLASWCAHGGLQLRETPTATVQAIDVEAATVAAPGGSVARLLICTKAHQTETALASLLPALAPQPLLVLLQNGLGVRERLQAQLPDARFLHAISTEGAYRPQPFEVVHAGHGETLLGAVDAADQPLAQRVVAELDNPALPLRAVPDIGARLWLKLAVNSVINPLTALHGCRNGELQQLPDIRERVTALCAEVAAVATAAGETLTAAACEQAVYAVMAATAANRSSMLQDIEHDRTTEIDFINGHIVALAARFGIACPQQTALLQAIKQREHAPRLP